MTTALVEGKTHGEFSVFWWDPQGNYHAEKRYVDAKEAVETAKSLTERPAALIGMVRKVIITDGGDFTNFMWEYGKGLIYPPKEELDARKARDA
jgi:hypothetical protein